MRSLSISQISTSATVLTERPQAPFKPEELPAGVELYARTPDFTSYAMPEELKTGMRMGDDAWGLVRVLEGTLLYEAHEPHPCHMLVPTGSCALIAPHTLYILQFVEPGRFFIEFHLPQTKFREEPGHC